MKKFYEIPEVEVYKLSVEDLVMTSGIAGDLYAVDEDVFTWRDGRDG